MSSRAMATLVLAGALSTLKAAVLTLEERIASGECAGDATSASLFSESLQVESLPGSELAQVEIVGGQSPVQLTIQYGSNFKVLTDPISKEQYVLTQCGTEQPSTADVDALAGAMPAGYIRKNFSIPVQTVIPASTVQVTFLEDLGLLDRVTHIPDSVTSACLQKGRSEECGASLEPSWGGNATVLATQLDTAELVLLSCSSYSLPPDCSAVNARTNAVNFAVSSMPGTLHSAEYVKFLAAFFNKEAQAEALFSGMVNKYLQASAVPGDSTAKTVAWIQWNSYASAFQLSLAFYKRELVTAAGGQNVNGGAIKAQIPDMERTTDVTGNPTYSLAVGVNDSQAEKGAAFAAALSGVDAVIDETYGPDPSAYTMQTFLSNFGLDSQSTLPFVQSSMVFRVDGTIAEDNGLDWFESRLARPDLAVEGLRRVLTSDQTLPKKYFRNIAVNEVPVVTSKEDCTEELPFCNAELDSQPIEMMQQGSEVSAALRRRVLGLLASSVAAATMPILG